MVGDWPHWGAGRGGQQRSQAQREKDSSHKMVSLYVPFAPGGVKEQKGGAVFGVGPGCKGWRRKSRPKPAVTGEAAGYVF
jgi:hypothetical protein